MEITDHRHANAEVVIARTTIDGEFLEPPRSEYIAMRYGAPACGADSALVAGLRRKLSIVARFAEGEFERRHWGLLALMAVCGTDPVPAAATRCRETLLEVMFEFFGEGLGDEWFDAARVVAAANVVARDTTTTTTTDSAGEQIVEAHWSYLGGGRFERRDYLLAVLRQRRSATEVLPPSRTYPAMTVAEIAQLR